MAGFDDLRASIQTDIFTGMPAHLGRLTWSADRLHDWQRDRLRALPAHGHVRVTVVGRSDEILHYPEADVHPLALRSVLLARPGVIDYLVSQTPRGVAVLALVERDVGLGDLRESLATALRKAGLTDPEVQVEVVDSLPRHPETGKLRRVVPA